MSVYDLLTPLPKEWANLNVNSINVGEGGSNLQGPVVIRQNSASDTPIVAIIETNTAASNINVALECQNQTNTATVQLVTVNDPTPQSKVRADGIFSIETAQAASTISLSPNETQALNCSFVSTGVTQTTIQNVQFPTVGGTPANLNYYEEFGPLAMTFFGPWGVGVTYVRNVRITRLGRIVTLSIDALEQIPTASVAADINTMGNVIPARFIPAPTADESVPLYVTIPVFDQSSSRLGTLRMQVDGSLIISGSQNTAPIFAQFQGGTTKVGFPNIDVSYSIV